MTPDYDEYGIPIMTKANPQPKANVDEFGIPIKKKITNTSQSVSSPTSAPSTSPSNAQSGLPNDNVSQRPAEYSLDKSGFKPIINQSVPTTSNAPQQVGLTPIQDLQKENASKPDNVTIIPDAGIFNRQVNAFGQTTDKTISDNPPDQSVVLADEFKKKRSQILNPSVVTPPNQLTPENNFGVNTNEIQTNNVSPSDNTISKNNVITGKNLPKNAPPPPTDEEAFRNKVQDNLQELNKETIAKAGQYASSVTDDPIAAGFITKAIMGDQMAISQKKAVDKGDHVPQSDLYNIGQAGISAVIAGLDKKYEDDQENPDYIKQKASLQDKSANLINQFPEYRRTQLAAAVSQELAKLHPEVTNDRAMANLFMPEIKKEMGLSDEDVKSLDFDNPIGTALNLDYPTTNPLTATIAPIYKGALDLGATGLRLAGSAVGADEDFLNSKINQMTSSPTFFNDNQGLQQNQTIVDANKNSKTFLQNIHNPDAGKTNYTAHTILNALGNGAGNLAWFVYGTKGMGAAANKGLGAVAEALGTAEGGEMANILDKYGNKVAFSPDVMNANKVARAADGGISINNIPFKLGADATNEVGMAGQMIGQGYDNYYQKANTVISNKPEDEWKRHTYALLNGALDYLGFRVLGNVVKGLPPQSEQEIGQIFKDAPNMASVNKKALQTVVQKVLSKTAEATKETAFVGGATTLSQIAKVAVTNVMGTDEAAKAENKQLPDEIMQSVQALPFSMWIPILGSKLISGVGQSKMYNENLYQAGLSPDTYKGQANKLFNLGAIDQDQLNDRTQVINTAEKVVNSIPKEVFDNLNHNQRVSYVMSKVKELALQSTAAKIDDGALSKFYSDQIDAEVNKRTEILKGGGKEGEYPNPENNQQPQVTNEISDTEILPTFEKVKSFIPEGNLDETQTVIKKVNNAENINVDELNNAENNLYDALDKAPEAAHLIEPLILKLQNYPDEFKTKTETGTTTEKVPIEGSFESKSKKEIKPALEQSVGSDATITTKDGTETNGKLNIKDGNYVLESDGNEPIIIGETQLTNRDLKLPSEERVPEPITFDKDGNVESVTFENKDGNLISIKDPEKALDLAIQLRAESVGDIPDAAFDKAYKDVETEFKKEVPLKEGDNNTSLPETKINESALSDSENKTVQDARDNKQLGAYQFNTNEDALKGIAMQAQNILGDGTKDTSIPDKQAYDQTVRGVKGNEDLVKLAITKFPEKSLLKEEPKKTEAKPSSTVSEPKEEKKDNNNKGNEPPTPEDEQDNSSENFNEWTRVNRGSLDKVKDQFRKVGIKWDKRAENAMRNLQKRSKKGERLYDTAVREMDNFYKQLDKDKTPRFNTDDQVAMHFLKIATEQSMANLADDAMSKNAYSNVESIGADILNDQYNRVNAVLGAMRSESGVGLAYGTVEARLSPDYGLKVRQMQMIRSNNGEPLNDEQLAFVKDNWDKYNDLAKREQDVREQSMRDEFDKKISDLQKDFEKQIKDLKEKKEVEPKTKTAKTKLSTNLRDISKRIRETNEFDKFIKGDKGDITSAGVTFDMKEGLAQAIDYVAKAVEAGERISDAIKKAVDKFKEDLDTDGIKEFTDKVNSFITKASLPNKDDILNKIKELAESDKSTNITNEMVGKNLIKNFVDSHLGDFDKKDILDEATKKLQEVLPDVTKEQVTEAYLKKGDFTLQKKNRLDEQVRKEKLALKKIIKDELTADQQQKIKLQEEKVKSQNKIEELQGKLDRGEFTNEKESEPITLNKHDAELINIDREKNKLDSQFKKEQQKIKENQHHVVERVADTARSIWVAVLIGRPKTFAKIAWFMVARPFSEVASKLSFGKAFGLALPDLASAAKVGGESNSIRSAGKMAAGFFRNMGAEKLQKLYENGEKRYIDAKIKYEDYKNSDNPSKNKLDSLKRDMNNKMFDSLGNIMYQFIGGSAIKDAWETFVHRTNIIEKQFGKIRDEKFSDGNTLDKINYVMGFVGRSHSALKTLSGRASFAGGFMARIEAAVERGQEVNGNKLLEIAHDSYLDWERGKYQQSNWISDTWNRIIGGIDNGKQNKDSWRKYNKTAQIFARTEVAITRVPVNIIYEEVAEYLTGAFRAPIIAAKEYNKARAQAIAEGYTKKIDIHDGIEQGTTKEAFKQRVGEIVRDMDGDQAAKVMRMFRKGGLGLGLYAAALIWGGIHFGIFPHKGQKKVKKDEDLKPDELNPGQVMFGNDKLGEITSAMISHTPALWDTFMGLGIAKSYKDDIDNGRTTADAATRDLMLHLKIIESNIPQTQIISPTQTLQTVAHGVKKNVLDPWGLTDAVDTKAGLPKTSSSRKFLTDHNLDVTTPENYQIKVDVDKAHPYGRMTKANYTKFKQIRSSILDEKIADFKDESEGLTRDKMKAKIKSIAANATKSAKKQMIDDGDISGKATDDNTGGKFSIRNKDSYK